MKRQHRMRVLRGIRPVREQVRKWKARGQRVAFVPTMGFFHDGHLSLIKRGKRRADRVVVSIFVNPAQFGPGEDLDRYPRSLKQDLEKTRQLDVDMCFVPEAKTLYREPKYTEIHVTGLENTLEGNTRPGHFAGVALVVQKLLHIVEPDLLILGQKDVQQAVVLETMIRDLDIPVRVERGPTIREKDGLAMSSRNTFLTQSQREAAPVLWRALCSARDTVRRGERSAARIRKLIQREVATEPQLRLDYTAVVDARTLMPISKVTGRVLIPVAAYLGQTRLIDNVEFTVTGAGS